MHHFLIVIEKTEKKYSAYSPDLLGCVATGKTKKEVEQNMYPAIEFHLKGMEEDNMPIPKPTSIAEYIVIK